MKFRFSSLSQDQQFFILTILTGIAAGTIAIMLQKGFEAIHHLIGVGMGLSWPSFGVGFILVLLGGLLTTRLMTVCAGSGVPRIKILLVVHHGLITTKEWITKFFATLLTLASGVPLGHEAPTIFIAGGVGSTLGRYFGMNEKRLKDLIYVGCSAGIAAAFNTPIAAVIFTWEEIVGSMSTKSMGPIMISSLIASITASTFIGQNSVFTPLQYSLQDPKELFFYLAVGLIAGIAGPLFIKNTIYIKKLTLKFFKHHRLTPILIAFCFTALLTLINPKVPSSGLKVLNELLLGNVPSFTDLGILLLLKFFAIAVCYGSGMSAGIMLPIMLLGGGLGGLFGHLSTIVLGNSSIHIGAYCLVGMGAFFASVIRTPFTSIILVFEMTRDYRIVLPLMVANLISYFLAEHFSPGSIYESVAKFEGYELPSHDEEDVLHQLLVEDAFIKNEKITEHQYPFSEIIYPDQTLSYALSKLRKNQHIDHLKVVDRVSPKIVLGTISLQHILDHISKSHSH